MDKPQHFRMDHKPWNKVKLVGTESNGLPLAAASHV